MKYNVLSKLTRIHIASQTSTPLTHPSSLHSPPSFSYPSTVKPPPTQSTRSTLHIMCDHICSVTVSMPDNNHEVGHVGWRGYWSDERLAAVPAPDTQRPYSTQESPSLGITPPDTPRIYPIGTTHSDGITTLGATAVCIDTAILGCAPGTAVLIPFALLFTAARYNALHTDTHIGCSFKLNHTPISITVKQICYYDGTRVVATPEFEEKTYFSSKGVPVWALCDIKGTQATPLQANDVATSAGTMSLASFPYCSMTTVLGALYTPLLLNTTPGLHLQTSNTVHPSSEGGLVLCNGRPYGVLTPLSFTAVYAACIARDLPALSSTVVIPFPCASAFNHVPLPLRESRKAPVEHVYKVCCVKEDGASLSQAEGRCAGSAPIHTNGSCVHIGGGMFLTNAHVVQSCTAITILLDTPIQARILFISKGTTDIAVLSVEGTHCPQGAPPIWRERVAKGLEVVVVGFPEEFGGKVVSEGVVSGVLDGCVVVSAEVRPGCSGGGVFCAESGAFVGVASACLFDSSTKRLVPSIGLCVPASALSPLQTSHQPYDVASLGKHYDVVNHVHAAVWDLSSNAGDALDAMHRLRRQMDSVKLGVRVPNVSVDKKGARLFNYMLDIARL